MATYPQTTWENHKAAITQLYAVKTLQQVMDDMKERHGFTATMKQWKAQLSKCGLDKKNIKPAEYRAMVRKKRAREEDDPAKATQFILHGVEVPHEKIARFESREGRNQGIHGQQGDILTPPGLACRTPPIKQDSGDISNLATSMATTCDSAATDDRSLIQTQQVPKDLTASIQTMQARIPTRSPSVESFDWFNEYIDYSESINSSPTTSGNALMEMLLRFQKRFDNYENERAYESFTEGLRLEYPCNDCRILNTFPALQKCLQDAEEKMTPMAIENWAQATVAKAVQSNGRDNFFMRLGGLVGDLYIDLGRVWDARIFLEQTILEIKRIDGPVYYRKSATLSLVRCYFESGNIQKADELLKTLFKRELPEIVASSYLFLEDYCREHQVRLLKRCYSKAKDDFVQDLNDTEEYDWEEDDDELRIRVMAARVTRTMNPGIFEEIGGCDNGFDCSVSADNDLDDKFDDDLVDDPDDELDNDMQSDEQ